MDRSERIMIRLTPDEKADIAGRAAEAGLSLSAFMRRAALSVRMYPAQVQVSTGKDENA